MKGIVHGILAFFHSDSQYNPLYITLKANHNQYLEVTPISVSDADNTSIITTCNNTDSESNSTMVKKTM